MFKIGDVIIGTEGNYYGITNQKNRCRVIGYTSEILPEEIGCEYGLDNASDIYVEVLENLEYPEDVGTIFAVESHMFKHHRVRNNRLARKLYPKANVSECGEWLYV